MMAGDKFARWTLVRFDHARKKNKYWLCVCECGTQKIVSVNNIRSGASRSCGCLHAEINSKLHFKHGMSHHPIHNSWSSMKDRCRNPNNEDFHHYGGRGVEVCDRWLDFMAFNEDMGPSWKPGLTLDRIDVNGNYEPGNCRWATQAEQMRNTRKTIRVRTPWGDLCLQDAAERAGITIWRAQNMLSRGTLEQELWNRAA